jgi:hypothetical protein
MTVYALSVAAFLATTNTHAEDARSILAKARELQLERWEGVQNYVVDETVAGMNISTFYERVGETSFRVVPRSQLPSMFGMSSDKAAAFTDSDDDGALADFDDIQKLASTASLVGTESIGGRKAYHLKADEVDHVEQVEDRQVSFDTFEIWVDQDDYVTLKIRIHGEAIADGRARPIVIEKVDSDYRKVPGSNLYEAYRQVMTMNGVLSPGEQRQLEDARKQIAEMEKQLASMPAAQRQMMEQMMGPQMEMVKKMAAGEGIQVVTEVTNIEVNVTR